MAVSLATQKLLKKRSAQGKGSSILPNTALGFITVERVLVLFSCCLILCCVASGIAALRAWSNLEDLRGVFLGALSLAAGLSAQRMLDTSAGGEE